MKYLIVWMMTVLGLTAGEKVVIHLDVNGTIMAADKAQNKTIEDYVHIEFAKSVKGIWRDDLPEMSYQAFVDEYIIPGNGVHKQIKELRNTTYKNFMASDYLDNHPQKIALISQHASYLRIAQAMETPLFPSFWRLLEWAKDNPFLRIVFRTFGHDIPDIQEMLHLKGHTLSNILSYTEEGILTRKGVPVDDEQMWEDLLNAVQDNHKRWHSHGESEAHAKPFMCPSQGQAIFFDDNAKAKHIIAPVWSSRDELMSSGHIVAVKTLEALTDPDYFISRVKNVMKVD